MTATRLNAFKIIGRTPLYGSVRIGGAKNASYKLMIAALLGDDTSRLLNFSRISDVELVAKIIEDLGAGVRRAGERAISINPGSIKDYRISAQHGAQGRFSTIFIPPLLHRFGQAIVPAPGGDKIGARPLDRHFDGLRTLGAKIEKKKGMYYAQAERLIGARYRFAKSTHTGTETLILAAVLAEGKTILENSALEPEIDDLIDYLNKMGAKIKRLAGRVIEIEGVDKLTGAVHQIIPDRNEAVSYACAALATRGDVVIENARADHLRAFLDKLDEAGGGYEVSAYGIRFFYRQPLQATQITTQIEPGFMTDWQPLWATLMTQAQGESVIHETVMANRFQYVADLKKMGVKISSFAPQVKNPQQTYNFDLVNDQPGFKHAIKITGPATLKPGKFKVLDLRHGATLILAAMTAQGESLIVGADQIDRGYEDLEERLKSMGANITRVSSD